MSKTITASSPEAAHFLNNVVQKVADVRRASKALQAEARDTLNALDAAQNFSTNARTMTNYLEATAALQALYPICNIIPGVEKHIASAVSVEDAWFTA